MPAGMTWTAEITKKIEEMIAAGKTDHEISKEFDCDYRRIGRYRASIATMNSPGEKVSFTPPPHDHTIVIPDTQIGGDFPMTTCPDPITRDESDYIIGVPLKTWVLSDSHIPFHERIVLECGVREAKRFGVSTIVINGDMLDCLGLSSKFHRRPDDHTFNKERELGTQFLKWLRQEFPKARIIWKLGNHEERLEKFLIEKAPEFFGMEEFTMKSMLECDDIGIEVVEDQRIIMVGKLPVLHGHEYQSGISAPVNPARGAFLRGVHNLLVGHSHQKSEHTSRTIVGKMISVWSTGCCCNLKPRWKRYNQWNNGFAFVDVAIDGEYSVINQTVINGVLR